MSDPEKKEVDPPAVDSPAEANGNGDEKKKREYKEFGEEAEDHTREFSLFC